MDFLSELKIRCTQRRAMAAAPPPAATDGALESIHVDINSGRWQFVTETGTVCVEKCCKP